MMAVAGRLLVPAAENRALAWVDHQLNRRFTEGNQIMEDKLSIPCLYK